MASLLIHDWDVREKLSVINLLNSCSPLATGWGKFCQLSGCLQKPRHTFADPSMNSRVTCATSKQLSTQQPTLGDYRSGQMMSSGSTHLTYLWHDSMQSNMALWTNEVGKSKNNALLFCICEQMRVWFMSKGNIGQRDWNQFRIMLSTMLSSLHIPFWQACQQLGELCLSRQEVAVKQLTRLNQTQSPDWCH